VSVRAWTSGLGAKAWISGGGERQSVALHGKKVRCGTILCTPGASIGLPVGRLCEGDVGGGERRKSDGGRDSPMEGSQSVDRPLGRENGWPPPTSIIARAEKWSFRSVILSIVQSHRSTRPLQALHARTMPSCPACCCSPKGSRPRKEQHWTTYMLLNAHARTFQIFSSDTDWAVPLVPRSATLASIIAYNNRVPAIRHTMSSSTSTLVRPGCSAFGRTAKPFDQRYIEPHPLPRNAFGGAEGLHVLPLSPSLVLLQSLPPQMLTCHGTESLKIARASTQKSPATRHRNVDGGEIPKAMQERSIYCHFKFLLRISECSCRITYPRTREHDSFNWLLHSSVDSSQN
jgi:hypothetical protein